MKTKLILLFFFLTISGADACPVCEKQQPKILQGITHGTGPESNWDYVIVGAAVLVVLLTLFYTLKWLFRPGEEGDNHIKRAFLN